MAAARSLFATVLRWAAMLAAAVLVGSCGGGSSSSGSDLRVDMTLTAVPLSSTVVEVAWSGLGGAPTRYELYANGNHIGSLLPNDATHTSVRLSIRSLQPDTAYCFVVYASYFPVGITSRSNEACVRTFGDAPPAAPTGVSAAAVTPARIDVTWTASADDWGVAHYRVVRDGALLGTPAAAPYADDTVNHATAYCYTIVAVDTVGHLSPASAPACVTTPADAEPPTAPQYLSAVVSGTDITLTWGASTDNGAVAYYRLERNDAQWRDVPPSGTQTETTTDSALDAATQYCYRAVTVDRAGNVSAPGNRACTTTSWAYATLVAAADPRDRVGEYSAIAVDAAGKLHLAYSYQRATGPAELHYLTDESGPWAGRMVTSAVDLTAPAIAVHAGVRHFAWTRQVPYYARLTTTLETQTITTSQTALGIDLAVDGAGVPHAVYGGEPVRRAVNPAGTWVFDDVAPAYHTQPRLALDGSGRAHVVLRTTTADRLQHAGNAGGAWIVTDIATGAEGSFHFPAVAVAPGGTVHVAYRDIAAGGLVWASNAGSTWTSMLVDTTAAVWVSLAVDGVGALHVAYVDLPASRLKYATNRGGAWKTYDLIGAQAAQTSIAAAPDGRVFILFTNGSLRLAVLQ